jgi:pimeloyl-ACP methyl ester carboxylesterase
MASSPDWQDLQIRLEDGRQLGYAQCGDPKGQAVLYFHGGLSSRLDINFATQICKDEGIRLIAPDRPGIGSSQPLAGRRLLDWPRDVKGLAEQLGLERFPVLGWSLGGPYSLVCGYSLPEMVTKSATVGCVAPFSWEGSLDGLGLLADRLLIQGCRSAPFAVPWLLQMSKFLPAQLVKDCLVNELKSESDKAIVQSLSLADATDFFLEALRPGVEGTVDDYKSVSLDWDFDPAGIQTPVQLWHGGEDKIVPLSHANYLEARIPNVKLTVVPQQGHFLLHKHLREVLRSLTENIN